MQEFIVKHAEDGSFILEHGERSLGRIDPETGRDYRVRSPKVYVCKDLTEVGAKVSQLLAVQFGVK